jgi:cytochrome c
MRMRWPLVAAAIGILAAGCGQQQATGGFQKISYPAGNPVAGAKLFATTCSTCHGSDAGGVSGVAPALVGRPALFTLYPHQWQLAAFIQTYMPKTNPGSLSKQQAANLAAFIYALNGKLGPAAKSEAAAALGRPPAPTSKAPAPPSTGASLASEIAAGESLYHHVCDVCHGANGQGNANNSGAPALWGTNSVVKGQSLDQLASFIKANMPLVKTNGVAPGSLTQQQATDVAQFILQQNK